MDANWCSLRAHLLQDKMHATETVPQSFAPRDVGLPDESFANFKPSHSKEVFGYHLKDSARCSLLGFAEGLKPQQLVAANFLSSSHAGKLG